MTAAQILSHTAAGVAKAVTAAMIVLGFAIVGLVGAVVVLTVPLVEHELDPATAPLAPTTSPERSIATEFDNPLGGIARIVQLGGIARIVQEAAQESPQGVATTTAAYVRPIEPQTPENGPRGVSGLPLVSIPKPTVPPTVPPTTSTTRRATTQRPTTTSVPATTPPPTSAPLTTVTTAPEPSITVETSPPTTNLGTNTTTPLSVP